ncbi:MAG: transposase, partial [Pseudobdellovibrionaceae bacterium]
EYLSTIPEQKELTRSQLASIQFAGERNLNDSSQVIIGTDIYVGTHFARQSTQLALNESYVSVFVSPKAVQDEHLSVGRKLYDWSRVDRHWSLGLWESKLYIDAIRTESQGLTGFFYYNRGDSGSILLFASPMFIPSQGPEIREERGTLTADSRWYRTPSPQFELLGKVNKIEYNLDIPDRMSLAARPGAAVQLKLGDEEGFFAQSSAGYKPVNELILERKNFKKIDSLELDVTVRPKTTYHQIVSLDVGFKNDEFQLSQSYLEEAPESQKAEKDWAIQRLSSIRALGTHFSLVLDPEKNSLMRRIWNSQTEFNFDYLKVEGGEITDYLANGQKDTLLLFDQRLQYSNSLRGKMKTTLGRLFKRPLGLQYSYLYDFDQRGSLIQSELKYEMTPSWVWILGADFIGVEDEEKSKVTSFLNQNRANDRYYAGMGYVF